MKFITKEGLEKLKKELEELKNIKRPEIAERLKKTSAFGDLTENAEYIEAKEAQAFIEGRILELEELIRSALLIRRKGRPNKIQIGSTIKVISNPKKKEIFTIVGAEEENPEEGKISADSPLGKTFLNKSLGTLVQVQTPRGKKKYKIIEIT